MISHFKALATYMKRIYTYIIQADPNTPNLEVTS